MPLEVKSKIALFADDAYLYRSIHSEEDCEKLQKDLDELVKWENKWSMEFHADKCFNLRVTNKRKIYNKTYEIHGQQLKTVNKAKYLGVVISNNLSWKNHIDLTTSKANNTRICLLYTSDAADE